MELEQKLREAFAELKSKEERLQVLDSVLNHLIALDIVQQMDYRLRMVFWKCNYHVYDFLRQTGQMGRESGPVSKDGAATAAPAPPLHRRHHVPPDDRRAAPADWSHTAAVIAFFCDKMQFKRGKKEGKKKKTSPHTPY